MKIANYICNNVSKNKMKKIILFLAVFFFAIYPTHSQVKLREQNEATDNLKKVNKAEAFNLSGKITNSKNGDPLSGASVYIQDSKIGTIADEYGNYLVKNIPSGHHLVEISFTGYTSIIEHLDLFKDQEMNFALYPSVVENEGVTVTGVSNAISIRKSPSAVIAFKKSELTQLSSTNIIDALTHKPGISQFSTGPAISKPVIRGLGSNRVVIINEGLRQEGQQWGDEHGIEIDELSINKVEVVKGPASLMYGSDALAGVINIMTNVPVPEGQLSGNIQSNYQSNNNLIAVNANIAGNNNGFSWNAYGTIKSAGSYKNKYDGIVLNSAFNEENFGGYIGLNKRWGYSHIVFSRFNQQIGMIEGERDDATGNFILFGGSVLERIANQSDLESKDIFTPKQHVIHDKIVSDNSFTVGKSRLKVNLGIQQNQRMEFGNPLDPEEKELFFKLKTANYNIHWVLPEVKHLRTTIGLNGMVQNNSNLGDEVIIPAYGLFDAGVFVYSQYGYKKTTFSGGLRFDSRTINAHELKVGSITKFSSFEKSFSNLSGSIGLSYEAAKNITFKANMARGFRSPNLSELASNGSHEGTNRYEYGDRDLHSETSLQIDLGMNLEYEHFSFNLALFNNRVNDFIFYHKLSSKAGGDSIVLNNGDLLQAFKFSQRDANLYGVEATLDIHPHPLDWLHFENTFSFVRGKWKNAIEGNSNMPLMPAPRLVSELRTDFLKSGKRLNNLYLKIEMDNVFNQQNPFLTYNTETATTGYSLINAGAGADFKVKKKTIFSLNLAINNLTDIAYQNHLSRLKYTAENMLTGRNGVFNMGRNFSVKLIVPLIFSGN